MLACRSSPKLSADAPSPGPPPPPPLEPAPYWSDKELDLFPMRESCLRTQTMVSDLSPELRARFDTYLRHEVMAGDKGAHVAAAFAHLADVSPQYVRIKEVFESVESYKLVESFLNTADKHAPPHTLLDLACGHGFAGILLAVRYPRKRVVCVDRQRRPAYDALVAALRRVAAPEDRPPAAAPPHRSQAAEGAEEAAPGCLVNLEFQEGDISCVRDRVGPGCCVVALHACNEANVEAIEMAAQAQALWIVMPCCIKTENYMPLTTVSKLPDALRYSFLCGAMASKYDAQMVRMIDARITNRAMLLAGGCQALDQDQQPVKLAFFASSLGKKAKRQKKDTQT